MYEAFMLTSFFEWTLIREASGGVLISQTTPKDLGKILGKGQSFRRCFPDYDDPEIIKFVKEATDWSMSLKASVDGKIVGFYLLGTRPLAETMQDEKAVETRGENLKRYDSMKGIEGVALGVIPEFRGSGIASQLKNKVRSMGMDFIYGMQYKSLGNLDNWTKGSAINRRLVAQSFSKEAVYITLEDISAEAQKSTEENKKQQNKIKPKR